MGGRYGADDDGSSEYQDRQPGEDRTDEQQTIGEAVRAAASDTDGDHPLTALGKADEEQSGGRGDTLLHKIEEQLADAIAGKISEKVKEETDTND